MLNQCMFNPIRFVLFCLFSVMALPAISADDFVIDNIRIEGLQRVDAKTAFANMPLTIGDVADKQSLTKASKQLFRSGYFEDINLFREGNELVVILKERPAIAGIILKGNKLLPTKVLEEALDNAQLSEGEIFQSSTLAAIEFALEQEYSGLGRYLVVVSTNIQPLEENRVELTVDINEGVNSTITYINIVGNEAYSDSELLKKMRLKTNGLLSLFTKDSQYSREKLMADIESIRSFYLDNGYVSFAVESTQVSVSPDKTKVFITISIDEGEIFTVGDVSIAGNIPVAEEAIRARVSDLSGDVFSRQKLLMLEREIEYRFGDSGFAFADVEFVPSLNTDEKTVDIQYLSRSGKRTYVRRITFTGNTSTTDEVLRREMRLFEGSLASFAAIQDSRLRLQRLGFFSEVNITTKPVIGTDDLLDINVAVTEGLTASWAGRLGVSDEGIFWGGSVEQSNFLGTGNSVGLNFTSSASTDQYEFSYFDPYYTVDGVSRGIDLYFIKRNFKSLNVANFATDRTGLDIRLGYPLSETSNIDFELGIEQVDMAISSTPSTELKNFVDQEGTSFRQYYTTIGWVRNTLNDYWYPTEGYSHGLHLRVALPNSDLDYYNMNYNVRYFTSMDDRADYVFYFGVNLGYANVFGDTKVMPPFDNYFAGGNGSVRGFRLNSLGPLSSTGSPIGGQILTTATTELIVPLFNDVPSVRTALFFDIGNTFTRGEYEAGQLRSSVGFSLAWLTPIGPLTFVSATPVRSFSGDKLTRTHISVGRSF